MKPVRTFSIYELAVRARLQVLDQRKPVTHAAVAEKLKALLVGRTVIDDVNETSINTAVVAVIEANKTAERLPWWRRR